MSSRMAVIISYPASHTESDHPMRTHKWADLKATLPPEVVAAAERQTSLLVAAIELDHIRRARRIRHDRLMAKLSRRADERRIGNEPLGPTLASVRAVVEAMGGELHLMAKFPDAEYDLDSIGREKEETP